MATVPISASNVRLLKDIPFYNDYKHTRYFATRTLQTNYFLAKPVVYSMTDVNIQRVENRTIIRVDRNIDQLRHCNYVMFQNIEYNSKWFYGFVTKLEYMNKNTTHIHFELDVYQTWCKDYDIKPSYVVREHCKLWNADGTPVINTLEEGLDYGKEYDTVYAINHSFNNQFKFLVIVSKTLLHDDNYQSVGDTSPGNDPAKRPGQIHPSIVGTTQPLSYYILPFADSTNLSPNVKISPTDSASMQTGISDVLQHLYQSESAVNNIVSIFVTENIGVPTIATGTGVSSVLELLSGNFKKIRLDPVDATHSPRVIYVDRITEFEESREVFSLNKYASFRQPKESKLLMHPYSVTTIDDMKGNRIDIKNEFISTPTLELLARGSLGTSNKVAYFIANYNSQGITEDKNSMIGLENALIDTNPNDVPILTDHLASFLQGNRNSIQNQKNTTIFDGAMNVASSSVGLVSNIKKANVTKSIQSGLEVVKGAGDTVLALQGIMAKQNDIGNVPPQIQKMGSNTSFDYGNRYNGVWIMKKQLKPEYEKKLTGFFNMYGYKVNEVKVPNITTRKYWNYVQTENCYITGSFNFEDLQEIKAIYDNGITFWHTDDIGNYSLENEVV